MTQVRFCHDHGGLLINMAHSLGCSSDTEVRNFIGDCLAAGLYHQLLGPEDCPVCSFLDPGTALHDAVMAAIAYRERVAIQHKLS